MLLSIEEVRVDGGTQSRVALSDAAISEYAEAIQNGADFPPVIVFHDGSAYWLADGFHRIEAYKRIGAQAVLVEVCEGTREDAVLFAAGANATHGVFRTEGDKAKAIEMVWSTPKGKGWTQAQIATHCHVTQQYVSLVLSKYKSCNPQEIPQPNKRTRAKQKRQRITDALSAAPSATNIEIARKLHVDRETVANVRAGLKNSAPAKTTLKPTREDKTEPPTAAPPAATPPFKAPDLPIAPVASDAGDGAEQSVDGYSTASARVMARKLKRLFRAARAEMSPNDWKRLCAELDVIKGDKANT